MARKQGKGKSTSPIKQASERSLTWHWSVPCTLIATGIIAFTLVTIGVNLTYGRASTQSTTEQGSSSYMPVETWTID